MDEIVCDFPSSIYVAGFIQSTVIFSQSHQFFIVKMHPYGYGSVLNVRPDDGSVEPKPVAALNVF